MLGNILNMATDRGGLSRRATLAMLGVTTSVGLAGCTEILGREDTASGEGAPDDSSDDASNQEPESYDPEVGFVVPDQGETWTPLADLYVEDADYIDDILIEVKGPNDAVIELDTVSALNERSVTTDTPGEYQLHLQVETADGETHEWEQAVEVDWATPESVNPDDWKGILDEADEEDEFVHALSIEDGYTEEGQQVANVLTDDELPADYREETVDIVAKREEINQDDVNILRMLPENPESPGLYRNIRRQFLEHGLDRASSTELDVTKLEKEIILGIEEVAQEEYLADVQNVRDLLLEDGYSQVDMEYLHTVGTYVSETLNGVNPRIEQAREHGVFQKVLENGEISEDELSTIQDYEDNGLISANDPDPENFSATPDPFGTGFLKDGLGLDPEKPTAIFLYEQTEEADPGLVDHAINVAEKEYEEAGIQTVWIDGRDDVSHMGNPQDIAELGERVRERRKEQNDIFTALPAHYMLFDEVVTGDGPPSPWGVNGGRDGYVNTDPHKYGRNWSKEGAVQKGMMAETLDMLMNRSLRQASGISEYYRDPNPDSEEGRKSWASQHQARFDRDNKEVLDMEYEVIMESGLNYSGGGSKQDELLSEIDEPINSNRIALSKIDTILN